MRWIVLALTLITFIGATYGYGKQADLQGVAKGIGEAFEVIALVGLLLLLLAGMGYGQNLEEEANKKASKD